MGLFSNIGKTAKRAVGFQSLKTETSLIKESAEILLDGMKESSKKNQDSGAAAAISQFSQLNPEDVARSLKIYTRLLRLFLVLDILGVIYFLISLARHQWILALSIIFFILICGAFSFRFHFFLTIIKNKNLNLSLISYLSQFFVASKK